eukprot:gene16133-biopygen11272
MPFGIPRQAPQPAPWHSTVLPKPAQVRFPGSSGMVSRYTLRSKDAPRHAKKNKLCNSVKPTLGVSAVPPVWRSAGNSTFESDDSQGSPLQPACRTTPRSGGRAREECWEKGAPQAPQRRSMWE